MLALIDLFSFRQSVLAQIKFIEVLQEYRDFPFYGTTGEYNNVIEFITKACERDSCASKWLAKQFKFGLTIFYL